jgi:hypothetical protein
MVPAVAKGRGTWTSHPPPPQHQKGLDSGERLSRACASSAHLVSALSRPAGCFPPLRLLLPDSRAPWRKRRVRRKADHRAHHGGVLGSPLRGLRGLRPREARPPDGARQRADVPLADPRGGGEDSRGPRAKGGGLRLQLEGQGPHRHPDDAPRGQAVPESIPGPRLRLHGGGERPRGGNARRLISHVRARSGGLLERRLDPRRRPLRGRREAPARRGLQVRPHEDQQASPRPRSLRR